MKFVIKFGRDLNGIARFIEKTTNDVAEIPEWWSSKPSARFVSPEKCREAAELIGVGVKPITGFDNNKATLIFFEGVDGNIYLYYEGEGAEVVSGF